MFCISIPQVNPNMLSCSISRPCTSVAQGYPVRSLKSAHLHSDTWSLCATLTLFVPLLQNPHSLILSWRVSNRAVPIFPELLFYSVHEVPSTSEPQKCKRKMLSGQRMLSWQKMHGWPPFCSTKQAPHTGPPQQHGRHKAKSFTTGIFTGELDTGKCLSSIILPISQDFKSTMWPISSQLTYREMCTQSNSPYQKLQSGFTIADPDTSMIS